MNIVLQRTKIFSKLQSKNKGDIHPCYETLHHLESFLCMENNQSLRTDDIRERVRTDECL